LLLNKNGVAGTTTDDIANETNISPGNLHYHFRKKSQLVEALLAESQVDVRDLLTPPADSASAVDSSWSFLHGVLETLTAYRFLFRNSESLISEYSKAGAALRGFTRALIATVGLHAQALSDSGVSQHSVSDARQLARTHAGLLRDSVVLRYAE